MDINNNQQIHTFSKGMNSDTSDMYLSNELYRYAENLRYSTNKDSNSGELRLIEGTAPIILPAESDMWTEILAMTSIRDYIIVVGKKSSSTFNIYRKNLGEGADKWKKLFNNDLELDPKVERINLLGRWESDKNVKLYMVDGVHPLMCIRIDDSNAELLYVDNIDDLSPQINYLLPPLKVNVSSRAGQLKPAKIQYAYTLSDDSGMETSLSVLSNTISLYNGNKGYSIKEDLITDKAIDIEVIYNDKADHLNNIRLYRITYKQGGQLPTIELFYDGKHNKQLTFLDTGSVVIKTLSLEEFLAITKLGIIPQEIEAKDGYLFLGNVKYTQDEVDELVKDIDCTAPSSNVNHCYLNNCLFVASDWYKPGTTTFGGKGLYFEWEFVFDDQWVALDNTTLSTESLEIYNPDRKSLRRGEIYRYGVILYDKHGRASSPKFVADIMIPPGDGTYPDFKVILNILDVDNSIDWDSSLNVTVGGQLAGHRTRAITGTIDMSGGTNGSSFFGKRGNIITKKYLLRSIGIKFTQILSLGNDIVGWLIVRVKRNISDRINLTLGIMGSPILTLHIHKDKDQQKKFISTDNIYAPALLSMQMQWNMLHGEDNRSENGVASNINKITGMAIKDLSLAIFMSPEVCYTKEQFENILPEAELLRVTNVDTYDIKIYKPVLQYNATVDSTDNSNNASGTFFIPNGYIEENVKLCLRYIYSSSNTGYEWFNTAVNNVRSRYGLDDGTFLCEFGVGGGDSDTNDSDDRINKVYPILYVHDDGTYKDVDYRYRFVGFSLNHLYPIGFHNNVNDGVNSKHPYDNVQLSNISFAESPEFNLFAESKSDDNKEITLKYKDNSYFAGTRSFTNWSVWLYTCLSEDKIKSILKTGSDVTFRANVGSGPTCALLSSAQDLGFGYYHTTNYNSDKVFPISVVNISRIHPNPYGGGQDPFVNKDYFYHRDHVINEPAINKSKVVFDGDCFVGMFTANVAHTWKDSVLWDADRISTIYTVPLESDINLKATCGDLYPRMLHDGRFHQQDKACMIKYPTLTYVLKRDAYMYNTAYSGEENIIASSIIEYKSTDSNNHDCRIHYSQPKVNGQDPDPWPTFKPVNYIDVDDRYGAITGLKLFKDKLIFWQENATGVLSVNEKAITQATNGSDIILGTSDVMQRYDYISTIFGMYKHQHAFVESSSSLYWWDSYNKEILQLGDGLTQLTKAFGLENYINTRTESKHPSISYDLDYDEMLCNVVKNETLVFSEKTKLFTSVYTFAPRFSATIDGNLYLSDNIDIYKMDAQQYKLQSYLFGNKAYPLLLYTVNANSMYPKTFDILTIGANFYSGDLSYEEPVYANDNGKLKPLQFKYKTPLNLSSWINGLSVSNREYDFRLDIPRDRVRPKKDKRQVNEFYGDRMRGKIMQCELSSTSNSTDFSLQYIITKYRMSWS